MILLVPLLKVALVGEVHRPHALVVQVLNREVGQHSSVGDLVASQVDLPPPPLVVDVVLPPLALPLLRLEGHWERACQDHSHVNRKAGSRLVVEEAQDPGGDVSAGNRKLNPRQRVELLHRQCLGGVGMPNVRV